MTITRMGVAAFKICAIVLIFNIFQLAEGQTIHKKDLPCFVARFSYKNTLTRNSLNLLEISGWRINTLDSSGHRWSYFNAPKDKIGLWFTLDTTGQSPMIFQAGFSSRTRHQDYEFYIMQDTRDGEVSLSILTVWEEMRSDSIRLICVWNNQSLGGGFSSCSVKRVVRFPDTSLLICISTEGGDGGKSWGDIRFLRGTETCKFDEFYGSKWHSNCYDDDGNFEIKYDLTHLYFLSFKIVETHLFYSADIIHDDFPCPLPLIDSAKSRVIDLWDMAKEYFKIDMK